MKEDILVKLVDEYLQLKGYFTRYNIKYRPDSGHPDYVKYQDLKHLDIELVGINPLLSGPERVLAVTCKSWQNGFNPEAIIQQVSHQRMAVGRESGLGFRELANPKWSEAFCKAIKDVTGEYQFTHVTAVTMLKGSRLSWEQCPAFNRVLDNPVKLITFSDILSEIYPSLSRTMASSEVSRVVQLIKASGWQTTTGESWY